MLGEEGSHLFLKTSSPPGPGWEAGRGGQRRGQDMEKRWGQMKRKEGGPRDESEPLTPLPDAIGVRTWHSDSLQPPPFLQWPPGAAESDNKFLGTCSLLVVS